MSWYNPTPLEKLAQGIGPSSESQINILDNPLPRPMPSHEPYTPPQPNSKFQDFLKGAVPQNLASDALFLNDIAGAPFKPFTQFLPESMTQYMPGGSLGGNRDALEEYSTPKNKEQFLGNLWGSLLPGPGEAVAGLKALGGMGLAAGSLDDVAKRMGKPLGSFSTEFENIPGRVDYQVRLRDSSLPKPSFVTRPRQIGFMKLSKEPIEGHLSIKDISVENDPLDPEIAYHGKGLGSEFYQEALRHAKEQGFKGLASDPTHRNDFSNQMWDRYGVEEVLTKDPKTGRDKPYNVMSEYYPRGREGWYNTPLEKLFNEEKHGQPILPEIREHLLESMRNRATYPKSEGAKPTLKPTFKKYGFIKDFEDLFGPGYQESFPEMRDYLEDLMRQP